LAQTYTDFELLLLNDGSTDGTLQKLEAFAARDARCKIVSGPNVGIVATLNKGLQLAKGGLVFRMDADDICLPTRFQQQVDYMDQHPECVILGTAVYLIDDTGRRIMEMKTPLVHTDIDAANLAGSGAHICHPTWAMRREPLLQLGGYREVFRHAEDLDYLLRAAEIGELHNLATSLLLYRQHASSIGYAKRREQVLAIQRAVTEACQRRGIPRQALTNDMLATDQALASASTHTKWAWWALQGGNKATARHHAWKAFVANPFSAASVKLLACAVRGY
jgi:glycosyltransferase involved in cell wall biosynthesis